MVKAVFFDIDGTLLDMDTHVIPDSTLESLRILKQKGIKIFVSTGRNITSLGKLAEMDFDGFIASNGQCCVVDGVIVHEQLIDAGDLLSLANWLEGQTSPIPVTYYSDTGCYVNVQSKIIERLHSRIDIPMPPVLPMEKILENKIYQISPYIRIEDEEEFLRHMPNCKSVRWNKYFSDIIPKNGSKANGLEKVLKHFEIPLEYSMAFGDGGNDIEMLRYAGIGIAMGNTDDIVQAAADHVTTPIMDNGIYNALKHFKVI